MNEFDLSGVSVEELELELSSRVRKPAPAAARVVDRVMFPAVCSECKKETQVPFDPKPGYPVFCLNCFRARKR